MRKWVMSCDQCGEEVEEMSANHSSIAFYTGTEIMRMEKRADLCSVDCGLAWLKANWFKAEAAQP